jgi:hypothetical protein
MAFQCHRCDVLFGLAASRDRHIDYMEARALTYLYQPQIRLSICSLIVITLDPENYGFVGPDYVDDVEDDLAGDEEDDDQPGDFPEEEHHDVVEPIEEPGADVDIEMDGEDDDQPGDIPEEELQDVVEPGAGARIQRPEPQRHVAFLPSYEESTDLMNRLLRKLQEESDATLRESIAFQTAAVNNERRRITTIFRGMMPQ